MTVPGTEDHETVPVVRHPFPVNWLLLLAAGGFIVGVILLFIGPTTSVALTNSYTSTASARTMHFACNSPVSNWTGTAEPRYPYAPPPAPASSVSWKTWDQNRIDVASACSGATNGRAHLSIAVIILSVGVGAVVVSLQKSRRQPEPGDEE